MHKNKGMIDEMFYFWGITQGDHKRLLGHLIQDESDLSEFMSKFYDGNILKNMMAYQRHKRDTYNMSWDDFDKSYQEDGLSALEELFQEPLDLGTLGLMTDCSLSHSEVFNRLQSSPNKSFLSIVTEGHEKKENYSDDFLIQL